jgi:hypothetical protein
MHLGPLIDVFFDKEEDVEQRDAWHDMIRHYCMALEILRKRSEYLDEDIIMFQDLIDIFLKSTYLYMDARV